MQSVLLRQTLRRHIKGLMSLSDGFFLTCDDPDDLRAGQLA